MAAKKKQKTEELRLDSLPAITPELIEKLMNEHILSEGRYHGRFHCGRRLGYGGSGIVYQLHYIAAKDDADEKLNHLSLAVKAVNPVRSFLKSKQDLFQTDEPVENVLNAPEFAPFLRGSRRVLESVAQCHENRYYEHHFLHYYPELSFSIDSVVPCASIVVMDEVAGTLNDLTLPKDLSMIIRMIIKLGREIGAALQASEYADDGTGFLHRDIKPGNIGIALNFDSPDVYEFVLIDIESGIPESSLYDSSLTIIVNEFSSPPELSGHIDKDEIDYARVDMYNLGCMMSYIAGEQFELLPEGLKRIIRKASHKDPSHRYDNGEELIEDLEQFESAYAEEEGTVSVNISKFMDEQKELLAEEKREHKKLLNELDGKLKKQRKDIREYKQQIKKWKKDYDLQIAHEEILDKEFKDYKTEAEGRISELEEEIEQLKTDLNKASGMTKEPSKLIRKVSVKIDGSLQETITCEYDAQDRLISERHLYTVDDDVIYRYTYTDEGVSRSKYRAGVISETDLFDVNDRLLSVVTYSRRNPDYWLTYTYRFNRKGDVSSVYVNDELHEKHTYEYDGSQITTHRTETFMGNGDSSYRIEIFNEDGTMKTLITYSDCSDREDSGYTKGTFTYNENKLETRAVYEDENHQVLSERFSYYDSFSRLISEITMDYHDHTTTTREFTY